MMPATLAAPTRRALLLGSGALLSYSYLPRTASAERRDPRFLAIVLRGFAIGPITPLVMRGPAPVLSWMPPRLAPVGDDTVMRLLDLYRHTDPTFAGVLEERIGVATIARAGGMDAKPADGTPAVQTGGIAQVRAYFAEAAGAAAKFLGRPDGPRVGALSLNGWDTHINE